MKRLLLLCCTVLSGCVTSGLNTSHTGAESIDGKAFSAAFSWRAQGQMLFRCARDDRGFFWQFIHPEGRLLDGAGRRQAVLQPEFAITAQDGSMLQAAIIEQGPQTSARNLRTVTFRTIPHGRGVFENVHYVVRRQATGGMPLAACSASQLGHRLRVPFQAQYIFYKPITATTAR